MRCSSGIGGCNGGYFNGKPFRCSKCRRMPDGSAQPPEYCEYCRVMHVPDGPCLTADEAGAHAIMALQKTVGIEEPKEEAIKGWESMSAHAREQTLNAYKFVVARAA